MDRVRRRGEIRFLPLAVLLKLFDMNCEPGEVLPDYDGEMPPSIRMVVAWLQIFAAFFCDASQSVIDL